MTKHIPYLDGWRGLAISCLMLGHFFPVRGINFGTVGVALFFVLSGLLMAKVLFVRQTKLVTFYQRRISRVFPSVAVYLLLMSVIFAVSGREIALNELLPAMTFTNNYIMPEKDTMPFGHIWSLSVEEHSYIILSVAAFWCRLRGRRSALPALGLLVAITVFAIAIYSLASYSESTRFHLRTEVASFGIFISGLVFLAIARGKVHLSMFWLAPAMLVVGLMAHWWNVPIAIRVVVGWGALALAINSMSAASPWFRAIFENRWLCQIGAYSFSLYLWQQPYYQLVRHAGMSPWVGLALGVMSGIAAYYLIENPARRYLNKRWTEPADALIETNETVKT